MKRILFAATLLLTFIGSTSVEISASAATPAVAGTSSYIYHTEFVSKTGTMSDTKTLRFDMLMASFDYDMSAVADGTHIKFGLEETTGKITKVGTGCCVIGGVDGVREQGGVSYGGGVWEHDKSAGETMANLKFYNNYEEFNDSKYTGLIGKLSAKAWVQIGDAPKVWLSSANAKNFSVGFGFKSFGQKFTVPAGYSKLWYEDFWVSTKSPASGVSLTYTEPKLSVLLPKARAPKALKIKPFGGISFSAYKDATPYYYVEAVDGILTIGQDGCTVSTDVGYNLPSSYKAGTVISATKSSINLKK